MASEKMSFEGWNIVEFLKGRKKSIISLVAAGLGLFIFNSEVVAISAGLIVEMGIGVIEYYIKKYE